MDDTAGVWVEVTLTFFISQKWIYIGQAKDIRSRLLDHFNELSDQAGGIWRNRPTHFVDTVDVADLDSKEAALIKEYNPVYNKT